MLRIREPNHLWWFMSHHSILWWTRPHPHRRGRILLVPFPLRRHPATARWLTSSTGKESRTWFGHQIVGPRGWDIPLVGGRQHLLLRAPHPRLALRGGPLVPPWQGGLLGGAVVGHLLLVEREVHPFDILGAPLLQGQRKAYSTPCGCPRCVVHYETCIQSLMAQVKDLRTQNLELQRSHQELFQAVASTVGISQSYGDRMTQILSTLAKFDAAVQGYRRDSKVLEASVADHLKMSNGNTAKCFSAVESLATCYATVASRIDAWDHWYSTPAEPVTVVLPPPSAPPPVPDPTPAAPAAPWARHPVHPVVGLSFLSPSTHPTIASTIRTLVRIRGGQGGGKSTTNTPTPKNLHRGGKSPKSRRNLLFPSGGQRLRAKNTPRSLRPRGPMKRRTPLCWGTLIPSGKMFSLPLGNLRIRPLILRIRVQSLQ